MIKPPQGPAVGCVTASAAQLGQLKALIQMPSLDQCGCKKASREISGRFMVKAAH
jgi:hypothetical protein